VDTCLRRHDEVDATPNHAAACTTAKRHTSPRTAASSGPVTINRAQPNASHIRVEYSGYSLIGPGRFA
jgi:hypothetical protein